MRTHKILKNIVAVIVSFWVSVGAFAQLNGTYTIGATGANYSTINAAVTALKTQGISGSVILNIKEGTYNEQILIDSIAGVSSINTVTFRTEPAATNRAIISFGSNYTIGINSNVSYVSFNDLNIETSGNAKVVSFLGNNHHITFNNDSIIGANTTSTLSTYSCFYSTSAAKTDNLTINNCKILNGSHGIYHYSNSSDRGSSNSITNNSFLGFTYRGIYTYYVNDVSIEDNYLGSDKGTFNYGIYVSYCDVLNIERNEVVLTNDNSAYPMQVRYCTNSNGDTNFVANNLLSQASNNSTNVYSYFYDNSNTYIVYNSFYGESYYSFNGLVEISRGNNHKFINNIVCNRGTAYGASVSNLNGALSNNCYYGNNGTSNLEGEAMDTASFSAIPDFKSKTDLRLVSSTFANKAVNIPQVTTDMNGVTRNLKSYIGAHKYIPVANDARLRAINPAIVCNGSNAMGLHVTNNGNNTLTSFNYQFSVNGSIAASGLVTGLSLGVNQDTIISIGNYTFNETSYYDVEAFLFSPNGTTDNYKDNDSITVDSMQTGLNGSYTVGGVSPNFLTINEALDRVTNWGLCGASVFNIRSGNYNEQLEFETIPGASKSNTITLKSESQTNKARITNSANYVISFKHGASNVNIDSLTIENTGSVGKAVTFEGNCNQISFNNDSIIGITTTSTTSSYSCIYSRTSRKKKQEK